MGKPNPSFQKRLRERKKQERREEKARRRVQRIADKPPGEIVDGIEVTDRADIDGVRDEEPEEETPDEEER